MINAIYTNTPQAIGAVGCFDCIFLGFTQCMAFAFFNRSDNTSANITFINDECGCCKLGEN